MLIFEVLENGEPMKPRPRFYRLNYEGTTRSAMWDAFVRYWDKWHGHQLQYTWRLVEKAL